MEWSIAVAGEKRKFEKRKKKLKFRVLRWLCYRTREKQK